ncbi:MAG TPA: hypothetical protein VMB21_19450 [Candidatus Limnocylindria bacterium]|jgi:hypothetical protein|nr:hypothetical protein [Candidatus Limnocylindria bacterium]
MDQAALLSRRLRSWTWLFIIGLVLSGVTAIPIQAEFDWLASFLGSDFGGGGIVPEIISKWLAHAYVGISVTSRSAPFVWYGTDWLAFGHLVIALSFVGVLRDPVRNRWLYQFALLACVAVVPWALVFGAIRGVPLWWRLVDCSFGVFGFVPVWRCWGWSGELEQLKAVPTASAPTK